MLETACPKPARGSGLIERRTRQKAIVAHERAEKDKVRRRDVRCRWPHCADCRDYKPRLEVAHLDGKKMGGDHGHRTQASSMMLLCFLVHQGPRSLHSGDRRIEPMTNRGTDGPCRFWEMTEAGWTVVFCEAER